MTANRRGFVLPAALLAVVVLSIITTAGFFSVQQESLIGASTERSNKALYLAEQGISEVLATWSNLQYAQMPQWSTHSLADTSALGIWSVDVTKGNDQIFYLDASGTITDGGAVYRGATRRVGLAARMAPRISILEPRLPLR